MNKLKIKSITEAFSMQPRTWSVCKKGDKLPFGQFVDIASIEREVYYPIVNGEQNGYSMYVAYDINNDRVCEWFATSVNVFYFTEDELKQEAE